MKAPMTFYYAPMASSLATRMTLLEVGAEFQDVAVDTTAKLTRDGRDYWKIHPLGLVPALQLPDESTLSETTAILQYLARSFPEAKLLPEDSRELARVQEWLSFISTELDHVVYRPLIQRDAHPSRKEAAVQASNRRFEYLDRKLWERDVLVGDTLTVADLHLSAILCWTQVTPIQLSDYPEVLRYHSAMRKRPSIAAAIELETAEYVAKL